MHRHSAVQYNYNTLLSKGVTLLRVILEKQPVFLQTLRPITASWLFPCSCIFFSSPTDIRRPCWALAVTIDTRGSKIKTFKKDEKLSLWDRSHQWIWVSTFGKKNSRTFKCLGKGSTENKRFLSGIARIMEGGGLPIPEFFGPLFRSAFLVNKKSLFLQKCQCIELLTVF